MKVDLEFPEEAGAKLQELVRLHPGKTLETVMIRAMTFYHACYDMHLQGLFECKCIPRVMEYLDACDDQEGR